MATAGMFNGGRSLYAVGRATSLGAIVLALLVLALVRGVAARQPIDEPQQARHDAFAAGAIDAAGHDQTDAHAHQHLTGR